MNVFKTYYIDVLKNNYFNFEGRATRKQYWLFFLFNFIIVMILGIFAGMDNFIGTLFGILYALYSLAVILPNLSIGARRLHDRNLSGWSAACLAAVYRLFDFAYFVCFAGYAGAKPL